MAFTATQYLFKPSAHTATTTATVGGYAPTASQHPAVIALTIANTSTVNATNYVDLQVWDGTTAWDIAGKKTPIYPGGSFVVIGVEKHVLPTGASIYITPYATTGLTAAMTIVEVT